MNCKAAARLFELFREESMDATAEAAVRDHLAECRNCRLALGEMDLLETRLTDAMASAGEPGDGFSARVQAAIRLTAAPAPAPRIEWLGPALIAAAACAVISLCFWRLAPPDTTTPSQPAPRRDVVAVLHQAPNPPPTTTSPAQRDYAIGEAFVIGRKGAKPYDGPTYLRVARVVDGVPELMVDAFPEG